MATRGPRNKIDLKITNWFKDVATRGPRKKNQLKNNWPIQWYGHQGAKELLKRPGGTRCHHLFGFWKSDGGPVCSWKLVYSKFSWWWKKWGILSVHGVLIKWRITCIFCFHKWWICVYGVWKKWWILTSAGSSAGTLDSAKASPCLGFASHAWLSSLPVQSIKNHSMTVKISTTGSLNYQKHFLF